ncbi:MAG: VWA domain-containing protein, partial [Bdellovibrionales bacterium]|nr:VWA domain-containing protein [Bdellovibrionales bacterium]
MKLFSALVIALLALIGSLIAESEKENVIIVLDASGSMWGQVNQEPKISIAKRVVQDLVNDWSLSSDIGLIAYGHRRKGDCKDIETIIPVSSPDPAQFKKVLSSLSAKGKTPLSDAVENAAETLKYKENAATVILVSDGIETCDRDPCKLASALESSGVNFTTHVVGFDLSQEDQGKIRCIADNTGGKFLAAHDAESLKASMEEAIQEITQVKADVRLQAVAAVDQGSIKVTSWELYAGSDLKETSS